MKEKTIAERRKAELLKLAERGLATMPFDESYQKASKAMNALYRYTAKRINHFINENNEAYYIHHMESLEEEERTLEKRYERIVSYFKPFDIILDWPGLYPTLDGENESNAIHFIAY